MRQRNPEDKKRRLLDAALSAFAERGLAATRIEDIAHRADCSAGLVYTYFGSKEALFEAVLADIAAKTTELVPMDADDLSGYAVRLHDASVAAPDVQRFVSWYELERSGTMSAGSDPVDDKVAKIRAAQRAGRVRGDIDPAVLALAVQSIARMWVSEPDVVTSAIDPYRDPDYRRRAVQDVVAALLGGPRA